MHIKTLTCIGNLLHFGNDIQVKESFVTEGDKSRMLSREKFGLKISVEKNNLSAWETSEVTTAKHIFTFNANMCCCNE